MENNKNKKSVKFQEAMLNFYDFIQVFVFTTNHHLKSFGCLAIACFTLSGIKREILKKAFPGKCFGLIQCHGQLRAIQYNADTS